MDDEQFNKIIRLCESGNSWLEVADMCVKASTRCFEQAAEIAEELEKRNFNLPEWMTVINGGKE